MARVASTPDVRGRRPSLRQEHRDVLGCSRRGSAEQHHRGAPAVVAAAAAVPEAADPATSVLENPDHVAPRRRLAQPPVGPRWRTLRHARPAAQRSEHDAVARRRSCSSPRPKRRGGRGLGGFRGHQRLQRSDQDEQGLHQGVRTPSRRRCRAGAPRGLRSKRDARPPSGPPLPPRGETSSWRAGHLAQLRRDQLDGHTRRRAQPRAERAAVRAIADREPHLTRALVLDLAHEVEPPPGVKRTRRPDLLEHRLSWKSPQTARTRARSVARRGAEPQWGAATRPRGS